MRRTSNKSLLRISISIRPEAEDAVVEWLTNLFQKPAVVYSDLAKRTTRAITYLERFGTEQRQALNHGLLTLRDAGVPIGSARLSVRRVPHENWAESWKRHFKPLEIGDRLLVLPSWSKRKPRPGQGVVILDPGLSFGTGHHPTTAFCLERIAACRDRKSPQSMLDIGTGSGILAIAAAKLGYSPVEAFDFDPDAVRVAKENAGINSARIKISRHDLKNLPTAAKDRFAVVCANLISNLLIEERRKIIARVSEGGLLVLAGILRTEFSKVQRAYEAAGMRLVGSRAAKEWRSGAFSLRR